VIFSHVFFVVWLQLTVVVLPGLGIPRGSGRALRFPGGTEPESAKGIAKRNVSERREDVIDLGHADRIDPQEGFGGGIGLGPGAHGNGGNLADAEDYLSDLDRCTLLVQCG